MRYDRSALGMIAAFIGSGSLLAGAYALQFFGGLAPCHMCLWQRKPHWLLVAIGIGGLFAVARRSEKIVRALLALAVVTALASAGLAMWHVGVEQKWWLGPEGCTAQPITGSIEEIMRGIIATPFVQCDAIAWDLFGISMAGYNFIFSLMLAGFLIWSLKGKSHG